MHVKGLFHIQIYFMKLIVQAFLCLTYSTTFTREDETVKWRSMLRRRRLHRFILGKLSHECGKSEDPKSDASAKLYWHKRRKPLRSITCISKNCVGTKRGSTNCKNVSVQNIESYTICPRVLTQNKCLWIIKMVWNTFENKFHKRIRAMFTLEPILYHKKNTQLLALTWASRWIDSNFFVKQKSTRSKKALLSQRRIIVGEWAIYKGNVQVYRKKTLL